MCDCLKAWISLFSRIDRITRPEYELLLSIIEYIEQCTDFLVVPLGKIYLHGEKLITKDFINTLFQFLKLANLELRVISHRNGVEFILIKKNSDIIHRVSNVLSFSGEVKAIMLSYQNA